MNKKAVIVLGMHRSGTSVITAGLQVLGVSLGNSFFEAEIDNLKGNFENKEVVLFNEKLLSLLDASWDNLAFGEPVDYSKSIFDDYKREAVEILKSQFYDEPIWGLKDPRMCLLLPFWQQVIHDNDFGEIFYIHILRNPVEVVRSQGVRHKNDPDKYIFGSDERQTLMLWLSYNYQALRNIDNDKNVLITFDNYMSNPQNELIRIGKLFGADINKPVFDEYMKNQFDISYRHHSVNKNTLGEKYREYPFIDKFYNKYITYSKKEEFSRKDIQLLLDAVPEMPFVFSYIAPNKKLISDYKQELDKTKDIYASLEVDFNDLNIKYQHLEQKYYSIRKLYFSLKKQYFNLSGRYFQVIGSLAWCIASLFYKIPGAYIVDKVFRYLKIKYKNRHSNLKKHIVVIDYAVPEFDKHAGARHTFMYLKLFLKMGYRITFISKAVISNAYYFKILKNLGIEILAPNSPHNEDDIYNMLFERVGTIEFIYIHRPDIAEEYYEYCKYVMDKPVLYMCHDIKSIRLRRQAEYMENNKKLLEEADKIEVIERKLFNECDFSFTPSSYEKDYVLTEYGVNNIETLPVYIYDADDIRPWKYTEAKTIFFIGSFDHVPNVDAVVWFTSEIFPLIKHKHPDSVFNIIGGNLPEEIINLASDNIIVHGYINDDELSNMYKNTKVVVIPIRYGAGVKGKVIETLFYGVPLVSTTIGLEGIDGLEWLVKPFDTPEDFAERICEILTGKEKDLMELSIAGQEYVKENYTEDVAISILEKCIKKVNNEQLRSNIKFNN